MNEFVNPARRCPECGSKEYVFRGRKRVAADAGRPASIETKYLCKACGHAWREKVAATEAG
jgi:DNA-directed RNA polymerase subunit M/transcription elongation factor TFIIS